MNTITIKNVFSEEQLGFLHKTVNNRNIQEIDLHSEFPHDHSKCQSVPSIFDPTTGVDRVVGRFQTGLIDEYLSNDIKNKIIQIASDIVGEECVIEHALHAIYSNKYGTPSLPPHFDWDSNDLIVNFQLTSNTSWDVGINLDLYSVVDNSALVFNANTEVHWRPHKTFNDGEYIEMIFFRCHKIGKKSDFSYMSNSETDKMFVNANKMRDSL
jgi:hypothetical protein